MVKQQCPHCGQNGITELRRLCLGPALPAKCTECGRKIGVPYWSLLTLAPIFVASALTSFVLDNGILCFVLGALGAMMAIGLWSSIVPLVKR